MMNKLYVVFMIKNYKKQNFSLQNVRFKLKFSSQNVRSKELLS